MRELERDFPRHQRAVGRPCPHGSPSWAPAAPAARSRAPPAAGIEARVLGREPVPAAAGAADAVLLCVPDDAIRRPASGGRRRLPPRHAGGPRQRRHHPRRAERRRGRGLPDVLDAPAADDPLAGHRPGRSAVRDRRLERLGDRPPRCGLATALGMRPFAVPEERPRRVPRRGRDRLQLPGRARGVRGRLLGARGRRRTPREVLAPLVLRSAANWADAGAAALTGPIARGDEDTVARHLDALRERAPELVPLYEALAERTRALAARSEADDDRTKIVAHQGRAARGARGRAARWRDDRPGADDGRPPRGPPEPHPRGRARAATWSS